MTLPRTQRPTPPEDCPLDTCLKFLSSTWTTRIIWFLGFGPRRFGDLRRDLYGISTKVLTERLRRMESQGLIVRKALPTRPPQVEYSLSPLGREFEPVLGSIVRVAERLRERYGIR